MREAFAEVVEERAAGSPVNDRTWTDLTVRQIQDRLMEKDLYVCCDVVRDLLDEEGYGLRKIQKYLDMGRHEGRDAQPLNVARIKKEYLNSLDPIISIDAKKKELLGTFYRNGRVYTRNGPLLAYDHDFPSHAEGVVIPYGIYDLKRDVDHLSVGTSKDTSEFACDSVAWWWINFGHELYPGAKSIRVLCDGGGSNSANKYLSEEDLQGLSDRLGIEIRVARCPPYCSKYNPIERRMSCHVTRACQGVLFDSVQTVVRLLQQTQTSTGLRVIVEVLDKVYQTGRKYTEGFKEGMKILFDDFLPKWNYRAVPQT